ncbi:hypothetical protein [Desulforamulus aeronauticus]|uniref:Uncharacterized protein n=1 Tax=Desulforamulus aeronauticus DSM 10349 TaxID=1121421 RepID=A0A1M6R5A9_9FIRM|nr:hypothetical protein [Desulforamulus aeronauticus]SHK27633.1 hypothetical protein SAMN02745123_01305 [Desulforamulus aeronauticus DSM 10349]
MSLYLDIDLDYFVSPIIKQSVSNHRPTAYQPVQIGEPLDLFHLLQQRGISLGDRRYLFINHMQSHLRWWLHGKKNNVVIHIDAHSDLYGHSHLDLSNLPMLGCQNYLWHSIREGLVGEIYWVLPENAVDITDPAILYSMFTPSQVGKIQVRDHILHAELNCVLPGERPKVIPYHLLKAKDLPVFREPAEIVTVASSPEFIPRQADQLIYTVGRLVGLDDNLLGKVMGQHQEMKAIEGDLNEKN